jgi:hypothetical protein
MERMGFEQWILEATRYAEWSGGRYVSLSPKRSAHLEQLESRSTSVRFRLPAGKWRHAETSFPLRTQSLIDLREAKRKGTGKSRHRDGSRSLRLPSLAIAFPTEPFRCTAGEGTAMVGSRVKHRD